MRKTRKQISFLLVAGFAVALQMMFSFCFPNRKLQLSQVTALSDEQKMLTIGDQAFPEDSIELELHGKGMTLEELENGIRRFPDLHKVILLNTDAENSELEALNHKYPDVEIVWTVYVGRIPVRTDETCFYTPNKGYLPNNEDLKQLRYCTQMIAVDIGHLHATECTWLEYMPHVRYLILADTEITDISPVASLKELVYLELFKLKLTDYSPLTECTALQDLNISSTHADPEPLSRMPWLHNLHWYQGLSNPETREAVAKLPEQLPDTNVMLDMVGNISNPWRSLANYYVFRDLIGAEFLNQSFVEQNWGREDSRRILGCDRKEPFAGDVLASIVKERIEQGLPIVGIKNIGSEKAVILYNSLFDSCQYNRPEA